jgi:hypothetical protein
VPPQFRLDEVLSVVQAFNQKGYVYLGSSEQGAIALAIGSMSHVLEVSSSGKGKSNRFRLAMMQLVRQCETYYINPFAAPVKAVTDARQIEVWQPIFERLANKRPIKEGGEIAALLSALVEEIARRSEQEESGAFSWQHHPIFVFLDELPEVLARCPEAVKLLDRLGRTGRQFAVFCWVASQTANVNEIGQSTAAQAQYHTRIYGGGDKPSADRLMKGSLPKDSERTLQTSGAGLTLMLAEGMGTSTFVRAPLVTNEALCAYFGLPTFRTEDWLRPQPNRQGGNEQEKNTFYSFPLFLNHQNMLKNGEEKGKGKSGKRGKGPNDDAILSAMDELEEQERPLTLNAVAKRAGLTRHQYDDIEDVAAYYGYELERGKGRPAKEGREDQ